MNPLLILLYVGRTENGRFDLFAESIIFFSGAHLEDKTTFDDGLVIDDIFYELFGTCQCKLF